MSMTTATVRSELIAKGWFCSPGAYVVVDGQYGSTGKGLLECLLADVSAFGPRITHVTSNQGPNSGHTGYVPKLGGESEYLMVQQLPVAAVVLARLARYLDGFLLPYCYLNAGAVIDAVRLGAEVHEHPWVNETLVVHPCAAIIRPEDQLAEASGSIAAVASTGKGVGAALAAKVTRQKNTAKFIPPAFLKKLQQVRSIDWDWTRDVVMVEVPQGFSLGINSHQFYPHTTSRECTVMQAIADARIPPKRVRKVAACYRTYPIRVGNTDKGYSGDYYNDQSELSWEELGIEAEYTTVTKRKRRIFNWSRKQFCESVRANEPDLIFLNFMNYLHDEHRDEFVQLVVEDYWKTLGREPETVLLGMGPKNGDVSVWKP